MNRISKVAAALDVMISMLPPKSVDIESEFRTLKAMAFLNSDEYAPLVKSQVVSRMKHMFGEDLQTMQDWQLKIVKFFMTMP